MASARHPGRAAVPLVGVAIGPRPWRVLVPSSTAPRSFDAPSDPLAGDQGALARLVPRPVVRCCASRAVDSAELPHISSPSASSPRPSPEPSSRAQDLYARYLTRRHQGESLSFESWCVEHRCWPRSLCAPRACVRAATQLARPEIHRPWRLRTSSGHAERAGWRVHGTWSRPGRTQKPGWNPSPVAPLAMYGEGHAGSAGPECSQTALGLFQSPLAWA
jgi:hypothetical protein